MCGWGFVLVGGMRGLVGCVFGPAGAGRMRGPAR